MPVYVSTFHGNKFFLCFCHQILAVAFDYGESIHTRSILGGLFFILNICSWCLVEPVIFYESIFMAYNRLL